MDGCIVGFFVCVYGRRVVRACVCLCMCAPVGTPTSSPHEDVFVVVGFGSSEVGPPHVHHGDVLALAHGRVRVEGDWTHYGKAGGGGIRCEVKAKT